MKFAAITLVKNECDIIELFIRINSKVIDHFFIIDNGSTDKTVEIIELMRKEGFKITLFKDTDPNFHQEKITKRAIISASKADKFDWLFPIDADEFLDVDKTKLEEELHALGKRTIAELEWAIWVPIYADYADTNAPLHNNFRRKTPRGEIFGKVVIPFDALLTDFTLGAGNHVFYINGQKIQTNRLTCCFLNHFPVRSYEQIATKAILGSFRFKIKPDRLKFEGIHWDHMANHIKARRNDVGRDFGLTMIGLMYPSWNNIHIGEYHVTIYDGEEGFDKTKFGKKTDNIVYKEQSRINEVERYDRFMEELCDRVVHLQKKV